MRPSITTRRRVHQAVRRASLETLEGRQYMFAAIDYLDTSGPAAHVGDDPRGVITADVNADGMVDLVTANAAGISVALGDGTGHFSLAGNVTTEAQVLRIATADLNGDGKTDLVIDLMFGDVATLQGNGDGTFGAPVVLPFEDSTPDRGYALVDLNADGKPDFVSGVAVGTTGVLVRYNTSADGGPITFKAEKVITSSAITGAATAIDVNGDGKPDLVGIGDKAAVLLNTGINAQTDEATFGPAATYTLTYTNPHFVAATDVTGDGKADILASYLSGDFNVLVNHGAGAFGPAVKADQLVINDGYADVNGDGKVDAFGTTTTFGAKLAVAHGNGDGNFQAPATLQLGNVTFSGSAVADVNSDGKPDVMIVDGDEDRVVVLLGGKTATTPTPTPTSPTPTPTPPPSDTGPAIGVDLTASAPTGLGGTLVAGEKAKAQVIVTNVGDAAANGPVTVKLYASIDGTIDANDTVLATFSKKLKVSAGKAAKATLSFLVPAVGDGPYQVLTQVTGGGDAKADNNAAPASAVTFTTPKVDVSAGLGPVSTLKAGKKGKVKLDIHNAGGATTGGTGHAKLYATLNGVLDGHEILLASTDVPLKLKAGKTKPAKLAFTVPAELAGQTRILVATVELGGVTTLANNVSTSGSVTIA